MAGEAGRLVLLCDARWQEPPGVCCWRHSVRAGFGALGLAVSTVTWSVRSGEFDPATPTTQAGLVIAESTEAARAAAAAGVPRSRLLALALPPEAQQLGVPSAFARRLAESAPAVGGFLTDSELARESIEQALSGIRPVVQVFPPLAVDRACPACGSTADSPTPGGQQRDDVRQLREWHGLAARMRTGGPADVPYSFVVARLLDPSRPWAWAPVPLAGWRASAEEAPAQIGELRSDWTTDAQRLAAARIWATTRPPADLPARPRRAVLVTGTNLKFAVELAERLDRRPDLDVAVDEWPDWSARTEFTEKLLDSAESVFAEWLGPSTVWLSRHKRPGQFLVARQHRYELETPHPQQIVIDNLDAVVYIAPLFGRRIRDELGWPAEKLVYLPNFLDIDWLDRPKLPDARFGIGMVGVESIRKRFDLALDLLAEVRRVDPRFTLFVRSVPPWDNPKFWNCREQREYVGRCLDRIRDDPVLRGAVAFDPPGRDMARWYRKIGHILSASDEEGSHMAPAEGMASGSVPVIRPWPGAVEIYGLDWLHATTADAAAAILSSADDPAGWAARAARAQAEVRRSHDPAKVVAAWTDLLHGDVSGARRHFSEYVDL